MVSICLVLFNLCPLERNDLHSNVACNYTTTTTTTAIANISLPQRHNLQLQLPPYYKYECNCDYNCDYIYNHLQVRLQLRLQLQPRCRQCMQAVHKALCVFESRQCHWQLALVRVNSVLIVICMYTSLYKKVNLKMPNLLLKRSTFKDGFQYCCCSN